PGSPGRAAAFRKRYPCPQLEHFRLLAPGDLDRLDESCLRCRDVRRRESEQKLAALSVKLGVEPMLPSPLVLFQELIEPGHRRRDVRFCLYVRSHGRNHGQIDPHLLLRNERQTLAHRRLARRVVSITPSGPSVNKGSPSQPLL